MEKITKTATIHTNLGDIKVNLFGNSAPNTVNNFIGLATGDKSWTHPATGADMTGEPLYKDVTFHRVIPNFMIQGGDPLGQGIGGPGYQFNDEIDSDLNFNEPYVLAMANAGTQNGKGTNGSQFFITTAATPHLQGKHTIFGSVTDPESQQVVDKIGNTETGAMDRPVDDVVIKSIDVD
ncbi:MAG: peptidylprolyl isomerase [Micrococcaceae bacterium]